MCSNKAAQFKYPLTIVPLTGVSIVLPAAMEGHTETELIEVTNARIDEELDNNHEIVGYSEE